jgi:hypothetical protein
MGLSDLNPVKLVERGVRYIGGKIYGDSLDPVDASQLDDDRERARKAYEQLMAERAGIQTEVPQIAAQTIQGHTVTAPTIDTAAADAVRGRQDAHLGALEATSRGEGPSAAVLQQAAVVRDIAAQQRGMAGAARGTAGVAARRDAMTNMADLQRKAALDAALLRATEQATARGQLTGALSGVREADIGLAVEKSRQSLTAARDTAQLGQDADARNQTATLEAAGKNQAATLEGQQITNQAKAQTGQLALGQSDQAQRATESKLGVDTTNKERRAKVGDAVIGGITSGGTALATKSDSRAKTDVEPPTDSDLDEFTRALESSMWRYKHGEGAPGQHFGPMADELARTKIGSTIVSEGDDGMNAIDTDALTLALAGVVAKFAKEQRRQGARQNTRKAA